VAAIVLAHRPRSVDLEDLLQDVAVKLVSKIHTLREPRAFRPWLRQIAVNVCRGAGRSERSALRLGGGERREGATPEPGHAAEPVGADEGLPRLEDREAAERLLRHVLTLPLTYREPLLLRCVHDMSYTQISDVLDVPLTTVETRLARARRMIREEIEESGKMSRGSGDGQLRSARPAQGGVS
jgi:RNA polymerase sigma-70 factor (ECF subfamily)